MKPTSTRRARVVVPERALRQRVNRYLRKAERRLEKAEPEGYRILGRYYLMNLRTGDVLITHVDLGEIDDLCKVLRQEERFERRSVPVRPKARKALSAAM